MKTTDGGNTWHGESSGVTTFLNEVHFPANSQVGYAVGRNGVMLKTTDGGAWIAEPGARVALGARPARASARPNPFFARTLISYEPETDRPVPVEKYNVSGTVVGHLVLRRSNLEWSRPPRPESAGRYLPAEGGVREFGPVKDCEGLLGRNPDATPKLCKNHA